MLDPNPASALYLLLIEARIIANALSIICTSLSANPFG